MRSLALILLLSFSSCSPKSKESYSSFGSEAKDFLRASTINVEVMHAQGEDASPAALSLLSKRIAENCAGTASITSHPFVDARKSWSALELLALERDHEALTCSPRLVLLYVPGFSRDVPAAVALGYGPHSVAIFGGMVPGNDGGFKEKRALVHELGHVLNLVTNPWRADKDHPRHDLDPACVMFYTLDSPSHYGTDFCGSCKRDLATTRGD